MDRTKPSIVVTVAPAGAQEGFRVDVSEQIEGWEYEDCEDKADKLKLTVNNYDLSAFDNPVWKKDNVLVVSWGYPGAMAPARRCIIKKVTGFEKLSVEAYAVSMLMADHTKFRAWENVTYSEIATTLAQEWGFGTDNRVIEETATRFEVISQARMSDAAFLQRIARKLGYVFFVDFDGFHFHSRQTQQPTHRVYTYFTDPGRGDVKSISIENDITAKPGRQVVKGRDPELKRAIVAENAPPETQPETAIAPTPEVVPNTDPAYISELMAAAQSLAGQAVGEYWNNPVLREEALRLSEMVRDRAYQLQALSEGREADASALNPLGHRVSPDFSANFLLAALDYVTYAAATAVLPLQHGSSETDSPPEASEEAAATVVAARARRTQQTTVKMKMTIVGDPTLLAKTVVEVRGIGHRLSGPYYVSTVVHKGGSNYDCELTMRSDGTQGYRAPDFPEATRDARPTTQVERLGRDVIRAWEQRTLEGEKFEVWETDEARGRVDETSARQAQSFFEQEET